MKSPESFLQLYDVSLSTVVAGLVIVNLLRAFWSTICTEVVSFQS